MRCILGITAGGSPLPSSFSMRQRNPLWTTFLIFMIQVIRKIVRHQVTPYTPTLPLATLDVGIIVRGRYHPRIINLQALILLLYAVPTRVWPG